MTNSNDYVFVNGNFTTHTSSNESGSLTAGTLEVDGDFSQSGGAYSFAASGENDVVLGGETAQNVSFSSSNSSFARLDCINNEGVKLVTPISVSNNLYGIKNILGTTLTLINSNIKLDRDVDLESSLKFTNTNIDLNGHVLNICGDLDQTGGNINKNGGTLNVFGKYTLNGNSIASFSNSPDILSIVVNFFLGVGDAIKDTVDGIWQAITHPIKTAEGICFLITAVNQPCSEEGITLCLVIAKLMIQYKDDFVNGDENQKSRMIGKIAGEIILFVISTKGITEATKLLKASAESGKLSELISTFSKGQKTTDEVLEEISIAADTEGASNAAEEIVQLARSWQGSVDYPGIDDWTYKVITKGTKIWAGTPGQSNFYTTAEMIETSGYDATKIFEGLQVGKGNFPTYRAQMTEYEVQEDIVVGYSKALANPQYGVGGFEQYFVKDFEAVLKLIKSIDLVNI